jgi:outer membrane protein OmpA-like peptidoglycan-associated protein
MVGLRNAPCSARSLLHVALLCAAAPCALAASVPLVEGLAVTTAVAGRDGDYESTKRLIAHEDDTWRVEVSATVPDATGSRSVTSERVQHDADLLTARIYRSHFEEDTEEDYPGTTALGPSRAVLNELRASGRARLTLVGERHWIAQALSAQGAAGGVLNLATGVLANRNVAYSGELRRRSTGTLSVAVNGVPQLLPVLIAGGRFTAKDGAAMDAELTLLDDPQNPLALQWQIGKTTLRAVNITLPQPRKQLADQLQQHRHIVLPGLRFDFGAATLRPESFATLPDVVAAIRSQPAASLRLDGHTDAIGDARRNHQLSLARAATVRAELLKLDPALAPRLSASGFGATRPVASNNTLEGRAQNRRVELVIL